MSERVIGMRQGESAGTLFIAIGQIHGNEPAGSLAIEKLLHLLDLEYIKNPEFQFKGTVVGLTGNLKAAQNGTRFIDTDLNRSWKAELSLEEMRGLATEDQPHEYKERYELLTCIRQLINDFGQEDVFILDLHTTTADGGVFVLPGPSNTASKVAQNLHAPIVEKLLDALPGTLLKFVSQSQWTLPVSSIVFESGQHQAADSVSHAVSVLVNCMRSLGMVRPEEVEHKHDELLIALSAHLPRNTEFLYRHQIHPDDQFSMEPGFRNFMPIQKGQLLAKDKKGPIYSTHEARILMPLYQKQGNDGFFVIKDK